MGFCTMNPHSIKLELVSLILYSALLITTWVIFNQAQIPATYGLDFIGIPFGIIAAAFGIPGAKLPQHRAYAIASSSFAVISTLCFIFSTCSYIYAVSEKPFTDNGVAIHSMLVLIVMALVFSTTFSIALATKTIKTAIHHTSSGYPSATISPVRSTVVVLSPTADCNSYLKMPPPLPIGDHFSQDINDPPPPYPQQVEMSSR